MIDCATGSTKEYEMVTSQGWKGKGTDELLPTSSGHVLWRRWAKRKQTGEEYSVDTLVSRDAISTVVELMQQYCTPREEYGVRFLMRHLIEYYRWHEAEGYTVDQFMVAVWGGKFRSKYLMPYYYCVMKVLEAQGRIWYGEKTFMWLGGD